MVARRQATLLVAALAVLGSIDKALAIDRRPPSLVVLGDSISDNGGPYRVLFNRTVAIPSSSQGYYQNRFSNGKIWSDVIADQTGVNILSTAVAGATACPIAPGAGPPLPWAVPDLKQQAQIAANLGRTLNKNRAVFIWIGINDISLIASGLLQQQIDFNAAMSMLPSIRACLKEAAESLVKYKFTTSMTVATVEDAALAPLWQTILAANNVPAAVGTQFLTGLSTLVRVLNNGIRQDIAELATRYHKARIQVFDMYDFYTTLVADAPEQGLNATHECLHFEPWSGTPGDPANTVTSVCSNPDSYLFWDYVHPTHYVHTVLAERIRLFLTSSSTIFG